MQDLTLRVGYILPNSIDNEKLDPALIKVAYQANLVRALYGRLLEFDNDGSLKSGIASSYKINNENIVFEFSNNVKTLSGNTISAKDAEISFKRLLILNTNTHGNLYHFLDCDKITDVNQSCAGISSENNKLFLKAKKASFIPFILKLLPSVDFSIIPQESFDLKTLKILNYRNTSGAYYLEKDLENDQVILKQNPNHPYLKSNSAKTIILVKASLSNVEQLFKEDKIDLIPTIFRISDNLINQTKEHGDHEIHETLPINLYFYRLTDKAFNEFSFEEIKSFAKEFQEKFPAEFASHGFKKSNHFFPALSEAGLNDDFEKQLNDFWLNTKTLNIHSKITVDTTEARIEKFKELFKEYNFISFRVAKGDGWTLPLAEQPHAYGNITDSSFFEDISLISYHINFGTFAISKSAGDKWIEDYINTDDKVKRLLKLKKFHLDVLRSLRVVPVGFSPYIAVSRNQWKINFSKYYAGSPLWLVQKQM